MWSCDELMQAMEDHKKYIEEQKQSSQGVIRE